MFRLSWLDERMAWLYLYFAGHQVNTTSFSFLGGTVLGGLFGWLLGRAARFPVRSWRTSGGTHLRGQTDPKVRSVRYFPPRWSQ